MSCILLLLFTLTFILNNLDINAANIIKQRGVEELGLTLSCRVKIKKSVLADCQEPKQLVLFDMPTSESTEGKRRQRSAPRSKRKVPGNSEQTMVTAQLSLFGDNLAYTAKAR
ncbi:MAG: hypothetical protein AAFR83_00965, partial [Cyanobacteria bacterium J06629_18]